MADPARVLVVEDTPTQAELTRALLVGLGHQVQLAGAAAAALAVVRDWQPDAILLDIELPDYNGFEFLKQLRAEGNDTAVIVVTAHGSINHAVDAMRAGALDFIVKPYSKARLQVTLANALELRRARAADVRDRYRGFIGGSEKMKAVYQTIEAVAASRASVFLTGESGTGKELAAEAVHRASARASRPFVALNCAAIPRDLLESEVFGHVKGAFTGATADRVGAAKQADGGTLFLDEIGEMPLDMQVKLLRFVQTGSFQPLGSSRPEQVDVRFVCATNRDPLQDVRAGRFREDLYYRLYVVAIELPPLRERGDDVVLIARHFLHRFSKEEGRAFKGFTREAERALTNFPWPGNVRQLQNVVRNVVVLNDGELVETCMLPPPLGRAQNVAISTHTQPIVAEVLAAFPEPPMFAPSFPEPIAAPTPAGVLEPIADAPLPVLLDQHPVGEAVSPPPRSARVRAPSIWPDGEPPPIIDTRMPWEVSSFAPSSPPQHLWTDLVRARDAAALARSQQQAAKEAEIEPLAVVERRVIMAALHRTGHDVPRAAALLKVNPSTIYRKLQAWKTDRPAEPRTND